MHNIRQNLTFAFLYNAAGVPIAAGVLYPVFGILLVADDRRRRDGAVLGQRDRQRAKIGEDQAGLSGVAFLVPLFSPRGRDKNATPPVLMPSSFE